MAQSWLTATSASQVHAILLTSSSQVAGITGMHLHAWLILLFFLETGSHYVAQAGLKFLGSRDPLALTSQSARITGKNHDAQLVFNNFFFFRDGGLPMLPRQ